MKMLEFLLSTVRYMKNAFNRFIRRLSSQWQNQELEDISTETTQTEIQKEYEFYKSIREYPKVVEQYQFV